MEDSAKGCFWIMAVLSVAFILYLGSLILKGISNLPVEFWEYIAAAVVIVFLFYIIIGDNKDGATKSVENKSLPVSKTNFVPQIDEKDDEYGKTVGLILIIITVMALTFYFIF